MKSEKVLIVSRSVTSVLASFCWCHLVFFIFTQLIIHYSSNLSFITWNLFILQIIYTVDCFFGTHGTDFIDIWTLLHRFLSLVYFSLIFCFGHMWQTKLATHQFYSICCGLLYRIISLFFSLELSKFVFTFHVSVCLWIQRYDYAVLLTR